MTEKIVNGDYVKNNEKTGLITVEYIEELLQNILIVLNTRRGKFYPDKDFGSNISKINSQPYSDYAAAYARQALDSIDGVFVKNCEVNDNIINFNLIINNEERQVSVKIENDI